MNKLPLSRNAAYWERELLKAIKNLRRLERNQLQMKPLVFEQQWQQRDTEVRVFAAQLKLAQQKEAKRFVPKTRR